MLSTRGAEQQYVIHGKLCTPIRRSKRDDVPRV